jgi:hypothetical protein
VGDPEKPDPAAVGLAVQLADMLDRLKALEEKAKKPEPKESGHWYSSELFSSVLSGVILAVFAFFLTGRIEQSFQERQLNSSNAKDMEQVLESLSKGDRDVAEASAIALSTYGRYAIPPLVDNLQFGAERSLAAERGLKAVVLTDAPVLCSSLTEVLKNRTQLYNAASHAAVIRILGAAGCASRTTIDSLTEYADLIRRADTPDGLLEYQAVVLNATASNVTQAKKDLQQTFKLLHVDYAF